MFDTPLKILIYVTNKQNVFLKINDANGSSSGYNEMKTKIHTKI